MQEERGYGIRGNSRVSILMNEVQSSFSSSDDSRLFALSSFIYAMGFVRCGGRLRNPQVEEGRRFPILLPRKRYITKLLVWGCPPASLTKWSK